MVASLRPVRFPGILVGSFVFAFTAGWTPGAAAQTTIIESGGFSATVGVEATVGGFYTDNTNFGTGRVDLFTGRNTGDARWWEGYIKPALDATWLLGDHGSLYGGASGVGVLTRGDGDAAGFTSGDDEDIDAERYLLGWRSGGVFENLGEDAIDLSFGKQGFQVGDGFLIYDGQFDFGAAAGYWVAPRNTFERAALLRVNTSPFRGDAFYLRADESQDKSELAGVNVEYVQEGLGTFGVMYFNVLDSGTPTVFGTRDGMDVVSVRANEIQFGALPDVALWAEYVHQTGSGRDGKIDADAWYAEGRYTFSSVPWTPSISYRYARFSGEDDFTDSTNENFDPFFYGFSRGWGTWFQGEITGEYLLFNSNQVNHMVHLNAAPTESLSVGAIYYKFLLNESNYFGFPVTDDSFTDEVNFYADWTINDHLYLSGVYALALPGDAAKQAFGDNDTYHLFEVYLYFSY